MTVHILAPGDTARGHNPTAKLIGLHVWFTRPGLGDKYIPDPIGQQGVDAVAQFAQHSMRTCYVMIAGGHHHMSEGESIASIYARALTNAVSSESLVLIWPQPESKHMASSTAGEIHFFRDCYYQAKGKDYRGNLMLFCAQSHIAQVRRLAEANLPCKIETVGYGNMTSSSYFKVNDLLLALDSKGRLMEFIAQRLGKLKQLIAAKALDDKTN